MSSSPVGAWQEFSADRLSKGDYIAHCHEACRILFELADRVPGSEVDRIEVRANAVHVVLDDGVRFHIDRNDVRQPPLETVHFHGFEPAEWAILRRALRPGGTLFDIGANIGWYTVRLAAADPSCHVHAFEPIPDTFATLSRNVGLNAVPNVSLHTIGLSDRAGTAEFFYSAASTGAASAANLLGLPDTARVTVRLETLDDFAATAGRLPDVIKCDVEGGELNVVRGGLATIRLAKPVILMELLRKWAAKFGYHPNDVLDLLEGCGYRTYAVAAAGPRPLDRVTETTEETNFLFLHPDVHGDWIRELANP
ncbi:MAG: FkbM family methyltransferase [Fimbriiglobus sp.]